MGRVAWLLFGIAAASAALGGPSMAGRGRWEDPRFDEGWEFAKAGTPPDRLDSRVLDAPASGFERVRLPHTPELHEVGSNQVWQGVCWYRKALARPPVPKGWRVFVEVGAAMHKADAYWNGLPLLSHDGGYLPFLIDLTKQLDEDPSGTLAIRLDNRDDPLIPPGKPQAGLDFCYYGGLYRGARLFAVPPLHLAHPFEVDEPGAGTSIVFPSVSEASATVEVHADVMNGGLWLAKASVRATLLDDNSEPVAASETEERLIAADTALRFVARLSAAHPRLWHPDHPDLYKLRVDVLQNARVVDSQTHRIGIRRFDVDPVQGFLVNGKPLLLMGTNRHNDFPYLGNAIPDRAQARDARKLKAAGFNILRLAHYPQSPAFLDACDELGMLAIVCTPGWQHFSSDRVFSDRVERDVRQMVRRDRNHACAALWETTINETYGPPDAFFARMVRAAKDEAVDGRLLACGDTYGRQDARTVGYDVPYTLWDEGFLRPMPPGMPGKGLHREYGDYEFGGGQSTSRVGFGDSEDALLLQAWNVQWSWNRYLALPWTMGGCTWVGIDHHRGFPGEPGLSRCGALDVFRRPKPVYRFFQSQGQGPYVSIAHRWTAASPSAVVVYSSCDEVALDINGRQVARQKPDSGPDTEYGADAGADPLYWRNGGILPKGSEQGVERPLALFDGGNCRQLAHPPFTFRGVRFEPGVLTAIGYRQGVEVARDTVRTPGEPTALRLESDDSGLALAGDGSDVVFVRVSLVDAGGTVVPVTGVPVELVAANPGLIVGAGTVKTEAGVASFLLRASRPATIRLEARAEPDGRPLSARSTVRAIRS